MEKNSEIIKARNAFDFFSIIYNAISLYRVNKDTKVLKYAIDLIDAPMPLPSGRWGNVLAVALEMRKYQASQYMIENASDLGIDVNAVSSEKDGRNVWSAKQTIEFVKANEKKEYKKNDHFPFVCFVIIYSAICQYNLDKNDKRLKSIIESITVPMPLPSNRWGNALAVALEMQEYQASQYMIENASNLGIDIHAVSSEKDGRNVWSAKQTFEFSKETFHIKSNESNKKSSQVVKYSNNNIAAYYEIEQLFKRTTRQQ